MKNNEALIEVLICRFVDLRLPRCLDIKQKLEQGGELGELDIQFLDEMMHDIQQNKHLVNGNQELEKLVAKAIHLNKTITDLALANVQKRK